MNGSFLKYISKKPFGLIALGTIILLYGCALLAPFFAPYKPEYQTLENAFHPPTTLCWEDGALKATAYEETDPAAAEYTEIGTVPLKWFATGYSYKLLGFIPCTRHLILPENSDVPLYLLGADPMGRDVFSRLLYGARISLSIGLIGIAITMTMGFLVGALSGYFGGRFDFFAMRFVEILMAIPGMYLLLALRSALAGRFDSDEMYILIIMILAFIGWSGSARVIRGMSLSIRNRAFVLASESMGQSTIKILVKHILPNLLSYLLVAATLSIPGYILGEAALSFLGLGIQEPAASWGLMLKQAQNMQIFMMHFWWMFAPGVALFVTVVSFNVLGDALRDYVDPKMKV